MGRPPTPYGIGREYQGPFAPGPRAATIPPMSAPASAPEILKHDRVLPDPPKMTDDGTVGDRGGGDAQFGSRAGPLSFLPFGEIGKKETGQDGHDHRHHRGPIRS